MKKPKSSVSSEPNILLRVIASITILLDIVLLYAAITNIEQVGWLGFAIAAGALSSLWASVMAIRTNNPAWILLDLIIPN